MAHIVGTPNYDNLLGTPDDDLIEGLAGDDILTGYDGNDTLDGGTGADTLSGYQGDDVYYVDNLGDVITGDDYFGTDEVRSTISYALPVEIENLSLLGSAAINGTGNELDNILIGNGGANILTGGPGIDTVDYSASPAGVTVSLPTNSGSSGDAQGDTLSGIENLIGSAFADTLTGDSGPNVLAGRGGADTLVGGAGRDTGDYSASSSGVMVSLVTNTGSGGDAQGDTLSGMESLIGSAFADTLTGDGDPNGLYGGLGDDTLYGGDGDDIMDGDSQPRDLVFFGGGNDTLYGEAGNDQLLGGTGDDTLYGGDGDDVIGNYFNDAIDWGSDALFGGAGNDTLYVGATRSGGLGDDTYYVNFSNDVVIEETGEGTDKVVLDAYVDAAYTLGTNVENLVIYAFNPFGDMLGVDGTGNALANVITGNDANNVLAGLEGNDTLEGRGGNDTLDGGTGFDTAVFTGAVTGYHFSTGGRQFTVTGVDGTDTLTNIEQLTFANLSFSIADRSNFDPLYYLERNGDVAEAAVDPLTHYRNNGWTEGRDPNSGMHLVAVDGLEYIASYSDLMAAFGASEAAGFRHFATQGLFEGRTTTFDGLEYIASYGDLINAFHNQVAASPTPEDIGATHYIGNGFAEHRAADLFDAAQYLANYADLQAAFGTITEAATLHYITNGYFEGRTDHALT